VERRCNLYFICQFNYDSKTIIAISFLERFWVLIPDCLMVIFAEVIVDWVKHAFITRFNDIPSNIYQEFTLSLAYDLAATKQKHVRHFPFLELQCLYLINVIDDHSRLSRIIPIWLLEEWVSYLYLWVCWLFA
jgi:hypothetical protein